MTVPVPDILVGTFEERKRQLIQIVWKKCRRGTLSSKEFRILGIYPVSKGWIQRLNPDKITNEQLIEFKNYVFLKKEKIDDDIFEVLESGKSRNGGFSHEQLRILGVDWPPQRGWKSKIKDLSEEQIKIFISLKNQHLKGGNLDVKINRRIK